MAQIKNASIHTSALATTLIMDDVSKEDSINPRTAISSEFVAQYEESIIGYLADGKDFNKVWNQKPEAVATDDGKYILVSGYHTITALVGVITKVSEVAEKVAKDANVELTAEEKVLQTISVDFEVIIGVIAHGKYSPEDTARYFASFSNVHGQNLSSGEKSKSAYNALSVMNLRKDEGDENLRPFMNDRELAALLGVGKSTVSNQRQIVIKERYGTGDANDPITGDDAVDKAVNQVANMENNAPAGETSESTDDGESTDDSKTSESTEGDETITRQDGGEQEGDNRAKGTEGMNLPAGKNAETEEGAEGDEKVNKKAIKDQSAADLRTAIDNVFSVKFDPDDRLEALNSISRQIEKARERMAEKYNKKDHEMFKTYDEIYSACLSILDAISNENEVLK